MVFNCLLMPVTCRKKHCSLKNLVPWVHTLVYDLNTYWGTSLRSVQDCLLFTPWQPKSPHKGDCDQCLSGTTTNQTLTLLLQVFCFFFSFLRSGVSTRGHNPVPSRTCPKCGGIQIVVSGSISDAEPNPYQLLELDADWSSTRIKTITSSADLRERHNCRI